MKISLKNVENALSRSEMKTIMAGTAALPASVSCGDECTSDSTCSGNSSCPHCHASKCDC